MDYIDKTEKQEAARKAVSPDLTPSELDEYSKMIAAQKDPDEEDAERFHQIQMNPKVKSINEAENIFRQEKLQKSISDDVDMTPHENFGIRDIEVHEPIWNSVVKPQSKMFPIEETTYAGSRIDRDCDQIHVFIKRFTQGGDWDLDDFILALGGVSRPRVNTFLEKRGIKEGARSRVFQLAWEFFKKRGVLGLPVDKPSPEDVEIIKNRRSERRNDEPEEGSWSGKRQKGRNVIQIDRCDRPLVCS